LGNASLDPNFDIHSPTESTTQIACDNWRLYSTADKEQLIQLPQQCCYRNNQTISNFIFLSTSFPSRHNDSRIHITACYCCRCCRLTSAGSVRSVWKRLISVMVTVLLMLLRAVNRDVFDTRRWFVNLWNTLPPTYSRSEWSALAHSFIHWC